MAGVVHIPWYATVFRHQSFGEAVAEISRSPATEEVRGIREPATGTPAQVQRDIRENK